MSVLLNPYLSFRGQAREAMGFYQSVFGGELKLATFAEYQSAQDPAEADWIMHGQLETELGLVLMGSDTPKSMDLPGGPGAIRISLSGDDQEALSTYFEKLSAGAVVEMPLTAAPWGDSFGMLTDEFGISWMVNIAGRPQEPAS